MNQEHIIQEFCIKLYDKAPTKFSWYTDGEAYGILGIIKIPYSTALAYNELRDKYPNSALMVNSNGMLEFGVIKNKKFYRTYK